MRSWFVSATLLPYWRSECRLRRCRAIVASAVSSKVGPCDDECVIGTCFVRPALSVRKLIKPIRKVACGLS